jgi:hypothetical protein
MVQDATKSRTVTVLEGQTTCVQIPTDGEQSHNRFTTEAVTNLESVAAQMILRPNSGSCSKHTGEKFPGTRCENFRTVAFIRPVYRTHVRRRYYAAEVK